MAKTIQKGDIEFYVTTSRNERLPVYNHQTPYSQRENVVYMNDGDEFKLEIKNTLSERIAAKIFINDKSFSDMLILRPGEKCYLERFLDDNKKFIFQTYKVDGDEKTIQSTENNGLIKVEFYKEQQVDIINQPLWIYTNSYNPYYVDVGKIVNTTHTTHTTNIAYYPCSTNHNNVLNEQYVKCSTDIDKVSSKDFETGRIEKGSKSNQKFDYTNFNAYSYPFQTSKIRLMARSNKPIYAHDIKVYCTKCGTRRRKNSHNFCPNCGTRYE